jgi:D-alanine-D-alanine ligase
MQVVVLAGGLSPERDVSIRSGRRISEALRTTDSTIEVRELDVDATLIERLLQQRPDCVIPLLHGAVGEDGALRDVLDALAMPFVGCSAAAARLAFDKPIAKTLLEKAGVASPSSIALPHSTFRELGAGPLLDAVVAHLGLPLIVKPTKGGSALGASIVRTSAELPAAMVGAFAYNDVALMERLITGTEVAVCVYESDGEPISLLPVEIVTPDGMYHYSARYTAGVTEFFIPARLPDSVLGACRSVALTAHTVMGLRDWSRTDLMVDSEGRPWFLEVNAAPGMTETSLFPQALSAAGMSLGDLASRLIRTAIGRVSDDRPIGSQA